MSFSEPKEGGAARSATSEEISVPLQRPLQRRLPVGAEPKAADGVHFRVWAPRSKSAVVELGESPRALTKSPWQFQLSPEPEGYFSALVPEATAGLCYKIRLDHGSFPDPASRFQPEGPHGPSQVIDPERFRWTDSGWAGVGASSQVLYEMHIGTFTPEGTWKAAAERLIDLAELGVSVLELMPVADFPGRFGWGYDGVDLFAPTRL